MESAQKLKRVVIKEELFAITGDTFEAIILGQLIYWQERVRDFDKFIEEEKIRGEVNKVDVKIEPTNGWIYKKASELSDECMLSISENTSRKYLKNLEVKGFISSRTNPLYKWDKVIQYRVNISYVIDSIKAIGYDGLSGYTSRGSEIDTSNLKICASNLEICASNLENCVSELENCGALPEITTETTSKKEDIKTHAEKPAKKKASIDERDLAFKLKVLELKDKYSIDTLKAFYNYWSQRDEKANKMLFETKKCFEIKKRLVTWNSKSSVGNFKQQPSNTYKDASTTKLY